MPSSLGQNIEAQVGDLARVTFDWKTGAWPRAERRYASEYLVEAFSFAHDYVTRVLGLHATTTLVRPHETYRRTQTRAVSIDTNIIEIYFTEDEIRHRKLAKKDQELTTTLVHEMIHGIRESVFAYGCGGIVERIASEGIAYVAQAYAEMDIFDAPHTATVLHDAIPAHNLLYELYNEPHFDTDLKDHPNGEYDLDCWMKDGRSRPYGVGQRLGVHCVKDMIENNGHDFLGIIHMPAQDIIGI